MAGSTAKSRARISNIAIKGCPGGGLHVEAFDVVELVNLTVHDNGRRKELPGSDQEADANDHHAVEAPGPGGGIFLADIQTQVTVIQLLQSGRYVVLEPHIKRLFCGSVHVEL